MTGLRIVCALAALLLAGPLPATEDSAFLAEFEDLPLAPGLKEAPGGTLFESPTGRIVEATASGEVSGTQVLAFYGQTLPKLGWTRIDATTFRRDRETLSIKIDEKKRPLAVHYSVVPN